MAKPSIRSSGRHLLPAQGGRRSRARKAARTHQPGVRVELAKVMSRRQQRQYWVAVILWGSVTANFWLWWLQRDHVGSLPLFVLMSLSFLYAGTLLPSMYVLFTGHMRRPVHIPVRQAEDMGVIGRVAVISLTVPGSESLEIVYRQLVAMSRIRYPHDSWILVDKEHSPEIAGLARSLGVNYFSRHDEGRWGSERVAAWNRPHPPFKRKTKAGNVNSWLDAFGGSYSHFTQLDIDHIPGPAYLDHVLGYFADQKVKWVQAPSVYGNHESWTARGACEQEFGLQGPLQMGFFGFSRTPFIIGSHCTYDTAAIIGIGGFQPTRAEDHLDTVCLAAEGYQGVFVPDVIAVGDGPETFETYLSQQFAWAYSMMEVMIFHTPRLLRRYRRRQAAQFLFVQTWYACWSLSMLILFVLPLISLVLDVPVAHTRYVDFIAHSLPAACMASLIWYWSRPWHVPAGLRLSWRGVALHVARWQVVLNAFVQVVLRIEKPYMITMKGIRGGITRRFSLQVAAPYIVMTTLPLAVCWFYLGVYHRSSSQGYLLFALLDALLFFLLVVVTVTQDSRSGQPDDLPFVDRIRLHGHAMVLSGVLGFLFVVTALASSEPIADALRSH